MPGGRGPLRVRDWLALGLSLVMALLGLTIVGATASAASTHTYVHAHTYDAQHHGVVASCTRIERGPPADYLQDRSAIAVDLGSRGTAGCSGAATSSDSPTYDDHALLARGPQMAGPIDEGRAWGDSGALSPVGRSDVAAETAGGAGGDLLGPLARAENEGLQKALSDPNKMNHLFGKAQHGFDPLISKFGSQEGVVEQMYRGLQGEVPSTGRFTVDRTIGGQTVHIDGATIDGVPRISTAWVVP